jgi:hypothetical protein
VQNYEMNPRETLIGAAPVLNGIPVYLWASRGVTLAELRGE